MEKIYSIIIPHHNTPDLLERCLNSIPERADIDVIVIDDNSEESIVPLFEAVCNSHPCVRYVLTRNGLGAGYARNIGLSMLHSKWVLFADSDDYFLPDAWTTIEKYSNSDADIIYFHSICRYSDTLEQGDRHIPLINKIDDFIDNPNSTTEGRLRYNYNEPWGKMIRVSLIIDNNILFEQTRWGNDMHFSTVIGAYATKIAADKTPIYCVTISRGSLVHQHSLESRRCRYEVQLRNNKYLREIGKPQFQESLMYSLRWAFKYGGIKTVWDFVKLGRKYNANFMVGAKYWIKNFFISRKEYQNKEKYIINKTIL